MSDVELLKTLEDRKEALFNLRFQKAKNTLSNMHSLKNARRDIAKINTLINEKKIKVEV
jgi:large subunit ribosomal protein L29